MEQSCSVLDELTGVLAEGAERPPRPGVPVRRSPQQLRRVCADGRLRLTDGDKVLFNSSVPHAKVWRCTNDSTCSYWGGTCRGTCNEQLGKCVMSHNLNLEHTCRGVFMEPAHMTEKGLGTDGKGQLLNDPPFAVAANLSHVLHECESLPHLLKHEPKAQDRVMEELMAVLNRSMTHPYDL
ncbi:hypothetical protein BaRGS_00027829 [Batillaria attramentaria]|uniref:FAM69 protein-kinase domain-containing protein n=1 Tax=Batillaria attramentaria TaxID=370345 RepID=A0ABD0K186_9CAEN